MRRDIFHNVFCVHNYYDRTVYIYLRCLIPFKSTWFVLRKTYQCRTAAVLSEQPLRCPRTRHFPVSRCLSNLILNWYPKSKGNIKHQCQIRFDAQYIFTAPSVHLMPMMIIYFIEINAHTVFFFVSHRIVRYA